MDRPVNTTASGKRRAGCVDDGIDVLLSDISLNQFQTTGTKFDNHWEVRRFLIGHRHFLQNNSPKRKRGNKLGTIPRFRFGLQKRSASAKTGAVQLRASVFDGFGWNHGIS